MLCRCLFEHAAQESAKTVGGVGRFAPGVGEIIRDRKPRAKNIHAGVDKVDGWEIHVQGLLHKKEIPPYPVTHIMPHSEPLIRTKARRSPQGMARPCQGLQHRIGTNAGLPAGKARSSHLRCCARLN
jgi:hypothetical protein